MASLEHGASPNALNDIGDTALLACRALGDPATIMMQMYCSVALFMQSQSLIGTIKPAESDKSLPLITARLIKLPATMLLASCSMRACSMTFRCQLI